MIQGRNRAILTLRGTIASGRKVWGAGREHFGQAFGIQQGTQVIDYSTGKPGTFAAIRAPSNLGRINGDDA
jgi:hypothetical protein